MFIPLTSFGTSTISFQGIKSIGSESDWQVGYLSALLWLKNVQHVLKCGNCLNKILIHGE